MKKFVSKFLSITLALALGLSMSVVAFAATVTANGYLHTVTKKTSSTTQSQLSNTVQHIKGTTDYVNYTVSKTTYTFNSAVFPSDYRTSLLSAYSSEGFVPSLIIPAKSGFEKVPSEEVSGTYAVVLKYKYGNGTWAVGTVDYALVDNGTFSSAPISYTIGVCLVA